MIGHFEVTQPIGLADAKCYKDNYYNNFIFEKATPKHYIPILANLYLVASCHPILDILHRTLKNREKDNNNLYKLLKSIATGSNKCLKNA